MYYVLYNEYRGVLMSPDDWLVSIDLPDAYHSVAMYLTSIFVTILIFEDLGIFTKV